METLPVTQVDLTAVLPRFLSLYVMSFLSPRDLCSAAQVSWHWRMLSEQVGDPEQIILNFDLDFIHISFYSASSCPGLSVGEPLHHKRLVPSLHSSRERIWSVEEPLRLLRLHPRLAHSTGGSRAVWDP